MTGWICRERILKETQHEFQAQRSCSNQTLILREVGGLRRKRKMYMAFLDVSKAYYIVWREGFWEKTRMYGVADKFIGVCQCLNQDVEATVVVSWWSAVKMVYSREWSEGELLLSPWLCDGNGWEAGRRSKGESRGIIDVWSCCMLMI